MLPSRPSSTIGTNTFGEIWTSHKSLGSLSTSFRGQTPRFHTQGSMQGLEVYLDEHRKTISMFQHVAKYNAQMSNILLILSNLEIKNKHIIKEKKNSILNL
jgi:hypothetical protein